MRRIRHIIKVVVESIIVYIDYVVNTLIARQTILNFINIDKLNLRLMKAFIYLSQFRLDIKHKFDKKHVISNVLFRFSFNNEQIKKLSSFDDILNLNTFYNSIVNSLINSNIYAF